MSDRINDDAKTVKKRKNSPVKEKAPLRDQIQRRLFNRLRDDKMGEKIVGMWQKGNADRQEQLDKHMTLLADWDSFVDVEPQGLWETSSNLHIPVTFWTCRAYHARMMQALLNPDPQFSLKARRSSFEDSVDDIQAFLNFSLVDWANRRRGVHEALDQWLWSWITKGVGYVKWRWDEEWKRYIDVKETIVEGPPRFEVDEEGNEISIPTFRIDEEEVTIDEKVYEGPCLEFRSWEDVLIIGRDITDPSNADAAIDRDYMTASDLNKLADLGIFDKEAVTKVIQAGKNNESSSIGGDLKQEQAQNAGDNSMDADYRLDRYEILEASVKADVDGSGINSDVMVWVHEETGTLLRATYRQRINKKGLCNIIPIVFHKRSGINNHDPMGLPEMMHPLAKELDAMHNMRIDNGMIQNMPFGFFRASSSMDPKTIKLEPGVLIPVDDPQSDVYFPTLSNRTAWGFQEEASIFGMIERLTSISDINLGVMSGKQGAFRTATGSSVAAGEMSANLNVPIMRLGRGWKLCLEYLLSLLQLKVPKGMEFRATGEDGFNDYLKVIDTNDLKGDYDLEITAESQESNNQIKLQRAERAMMMQQDPMAAQFGTINPQTYYNAQKDLLKAMGIKNTSKYLNAEFDAGIVLTPEEELMRIIDGFQVKVMPNADHQGFVQLAQEWIADENKDISEEAQTLIEVQMQQHIQMEQAMAQAQAQQANINQQRFNAGQGAQAQLGGEGIENNIGG